MRRRLLAAAVTVTLFTPVLAGCHSSPTQNDGGSPTSSDAAPHHRTTRQFIPELGIYLALPQDWVAFADGVHDNKGIVTFQVRPKWDSSDVAQYVRIRKLTPTPDLPEVATWLGESNADAVANFVTMQKSKVTADKRDSWDGPALPGASALIEFEKPAQAPDAPAPIARKIYVAFVGQGDARWQVATTNAPKDNPSEQFLGDQADALARSIQQLNN